MKKKIIIPIFMLSCMFFLAGCSKVSLTGNNNTGKNSAGGGAPTEGSAPTDNGGTPPSGSAPTDSGGTSGGGGSAPSGDAN